MWKNGSYYFASGVNCASRRVSAASVKLGLTRSENSQQQFGFAHSSFSAKELLADRCVNGLRCRPHRRQLLQRNALKSARIGRRSLDATVADILICASQFLRWVPALVPLGYASLHSTGTRELFARADGRGHSVGQ